MTSPRAHDGFTLVELLVAITMAMIVFAATLNVLGVFSNDSQAMTQRNAAQNAARLGMDRIIRQLRNIASPSVTSAKLLELAGPYSIVFETEASTSAQNPNGLERVRYCIPQDPSPGSPDTEVVLAQSQTWTTSTAPTIPWSSDCPDPHFSARAIVTGVTNRSQGQSRPAFTYNGGAAPSDLSKIGTVGLDLFVNPTPKLADAESELRSAAFLRNQQRPPVAAFTATPLGGGSVLLNAGGSYSPNGDSLSYSWSCTPGSCSSTGAIFDWQPGASPDPYTVTLTVTDQSGLQATSQQQVTVS